MAAIHLYQLLDLFWLGRVSPAAVAAVGIGVSVRWAASSLAIGLSAGGMSVVAHRIGDRDYKGASVAAWQAIVLAVALAAILSAAGLRLAAPLLRLLGVRGEILPLSLSYLRLTFLGLVPLVFVFTVSALWQGAGAARLASRVLVASTGVGLLLEPLLVLGAGPWRGLGIVGAALAAVAGPAFGALVGLALLARGTTGLHLVRGTLGLSPRVMGGILATGGPSGLQLAARALARLTLIGLIARYGAAALAGYAVANSILMLILIPSLALGNVAASLVVQSLGSGRPEQASRRAWAIGAANIGYVTAVTVSVFALAPQAIAAFSGAPDVVAYGADALRLVGLGYVASSLGVVMARGLDATGHAVPAGATNVLTLWGVQIPAAAVLTHLLGASGIWLGLAIGGVANGLLMSYRFRRGRWRVG